MRFFPFAIILIAFSFFVSACSLLNSSEPMSEYIIEGGLRVEFPESWIGKVEAVEYEKHTEFIYKDLPEEINMLFHIVHYTKEDWEAGRKEVYGGRMIATSENYLFQWTFPSKVIDGHVVEERFTCSGQRDFDNCEEKKEIFFDLLNELDRDQHFTMVEDYIAPTEPKPASKTSPNVRLDYVKHGYSPAPIDVPDGYTWEEAVTNGDVVIVDGVVYNGEKLIQFIDNVQHSRTDAFRYFEFNPQYEGSMNVEEFLYDGDTIEYKVDNTRIFMGGMFIGERTARGIDYEITNTVFTGDALERESVALYLTDLREDEHQWADERYLVKYIPVEYFPDEIVTKLRE